MGVCLQGNRKDGRHLTKGENNCFFFGSRKGKEDVELNVLEYGKHDEL